MEDQIGSTGTPPLLARSQWSELLQWQHEHFIFAHDPGCEAELQNTVQGQRPSKAHAREAEHHDGLSPSYHTAVVAGRALGDRLRDLIGKAEPNVALIALQHALVETVVGLEQDHLAVIDGCTAAIRQMVLAATPWRVTHDPDERVH